MKNVGTIDKVARILGGAALLALTFFGPYTETLYPWGLVGIVPLVTGLMGWCPVYSLLGIKTCPAKQ